MKYLYLFLFCLISLKASGQHNKWVALPPIRELVEVREKQFYSLPDLRIGLATFKPKFSVDSLFLSPKKDSAKIFIRYMSGIACMGLDTGDIADYYCYGKISDINGSQWPPADYITKIRGDSVFVFPYRNSPGLFMPGELSLQKITGNVQKYMGEHLYSPTMFYAFPHVEEGYTLTPLKKKVPSCGGVWITTSLRKPVAILAGDYLIEIKGDALKKIDTKNKVFFNADNHKYDPVNNRWEFDVRLAAEAAPSVTMYFRNSGKDTAHISKCDPSKGFSTASYTMQGIPPGEWGVITFTFVKESLLQRKQWNGSFNLQFKESENPSIQVNYKLNVIKQD